MSNIHWPVKTWARILGLCWFAALPGRVSAGSQQVSVVAGGAVHVQGTNEFTPTSWLLQVPVPAGSEWRLTGYPWVVVERRSDGVWRRVEGPPGGPSTAGPSRFVAQVRGKGMRAVAMQAGRMFRWHEELIDWRVISYPGEYRARVRWIINNELVIRDTPWREFQVSATAAGILHQARDSGNTLWSTYKTFLNTPVDMRVLDTMNREGSTGMHQILVQVNNLSPTATLAGELALPQGLRDRVRILRICQRLKEAMASPQGAPRTQLLGALEAECIECGNLPGVSGPLAKALRIGCRRQNGDRSPAFEQLVASVKSEPGVWGGVLPFGPLRRVLEPPRPKPPVSAPGGPPGGPPPPTGRTLPGGRTGGIR